MKPALLLLLAASSIALVLKTGASWGHDALPTAAQPLGWSYGWECCSANDCSQMQQGEIIEGPGGYRIKRTGEVIPYTDKRIKLSRDEFYHRCARAANFDDPKSLCLYVPDRGM